MNHITAIESGAEEFVSIDIKADVLRQLIIDQKLAASQLHCANRGSKSIVHHALLESVKRSF